MWPILDRIADRVSFAMYRRIRRRLRHEHFVWGDWARLHLSSTAQVNDALFNTVSGEVHVGDHVMFGHDVQVITGTHYIERFGPERWEHPDAGRDVVIEEGAWIGSRATVLGPCRIGRHAVVAAGAVVVDDVEPYTVVGGVPARELRRLEPPPHPG